MTYYSSNLLRAALIVLMLSFISCSENQVSPDLEENDSFSITYSESMDAKADKGHTGGHEEAIISEKLAEINDRLTENGFNNIEISKAETFTLFEGGSFQSGQTIIANDRFKTLPAQWLPGDERRGADGNNLTYLNFSPFMVANGSINAEGAIDSSFETWNNLKANAGPELVKVEDTGVFPSAILTLGGQPGNPFLADISTLGFLPGFIFDQVLGPGASNSVLGVAFTFTWTGTNEVALKEIWYNDRFQWSTNGTPGTVDIESVALHENGHALGFAHFGRLAINNASNKLIVAPKAVMNASYLGAQRELLGTDKASYSNVYGSWPKD